MDLSPSIPCHFSVGSPHFSFPKKLQECFNDFDVDYLEIPSCFLSCLSLNNVNKGQCLSQIWQEGKCFHYSLWIQILSLILPLLASFSYSSYCLSSPMIPSPESYPFWNFEQWFFALSKLTKTTTGLSTYQACCLHKINTRFSSYIGSCTVHYTYYYVQ